MTLRCTICKLDPTKLGVIDSALRSGTSLRVVADENGLTKSALGRHAQHVVGYNAAATPPKPARSLKTRASAPPKPTLPSPVVKAPVEPAEPALETPIDVESRRRQALERCELLFREALAGLEDSKQPIVVNKGNGTLEIPGDLRARAAFVRAARDVLSLDAELSGVYDDQAAPHFGEVVFQNVILMPKTTTVETRAKVVEVQPEPAALTDGGTPDSEK